jgi:hypothetical protein
MTELLQTHIWTWYISAISIAVLIKEEDIKGLFCSEIVKINKLTVAANFVWTTVSDRYIRA